MAHARIAGGLAGRGPSIFFGSAVLQMRGANLRRAKVCTVSARSIRAMDTMCCPCCLAHDVGCHLRWSLCALPVWIASQNGGCRRCCQLLDHAGPPYNPQGCTRSSSCWHLRHRCTCQRLIINTINRAKINTGRPSLQNGAAYHHAPREWLRVSLITVRNGAM